MANNLAILDLGTNTFHLLIVEITTDGYKALYKEKKFVKLGEHGLHKFNNEVVNRAVNVVEYYQKKILDHNVKDAVIFGTAGLRMASNAASLVKKIEYITGVKVKIINGADEAKLIFYGVKQSLPEFRQNYFIMDIGGGSVEFIIANNNKVLWARSFNIGVSLLRNSFHKNEPITENQVEKLYQFLQKELIPLKDALQKHKTIILVGASGSFDTIADMSESLNLKDGFIELSVDDFESIKKDLTAKTHEQRLNTKGLVNDRADMIVVALLLIDYIVKTFKIKKMYKSDFALKEGIIWAYLNKPKYLKAI